MPDRRDFSTGADALWAAACAPAPGLTGLSGASGVVDVIPAGALLIGGDCLVLADLNDFLVT